MAIVKMRKSEIERRRRISVLGLHRLALKVARKSKITVPPLSKSPEEEVRSITPPPSTPPPSPPYNYIAGEPSSPPASRFLRISPAVAARVSSSTRAPYLTSAVARVSSPPRSPPPPGFILSSSSSCSSRTAVKSKFYRNRPIVPIPFSLSSSSSSLPPSPSANGYIADDTSSPLSSRFSRISLTTTATRVSSSTRAPHLTTAAARVSPPPGFILSSSSSCSSQMSVNSRFCRNRPIIPIPFCLSLSPPSSPPSAYSNNAPSFLSLGRT